MSMNDIALNQWGEKFMDELDNEVLQEGNEEVRHFWAAGEVPPVLDWVKENHPDLSEQQLDWVGDWLAETEV